MKLRAICKRCHRFRVVGETGHCERCFGKLRADEKPKKHQAPADEVLEALTEAIGSDGTRCPHCAENDIKATLESVNTARGRVDRCWQCGGEYQKDVRVWPKTCELCVDPIDKPHVDADGSNRWRACRNPATRQVLDETGRPIDICEDHFAKGAS